MMKKIARSILFVFAAVLVLNVTILFRSATADASDKRLFDEADLLDRDERDAIKDKIEEIQDKTNMDFVVVTIDDAEGKSSSEYADDFYDEDDEFGYGDDYSGSLLLLDMDNREIYLSTSGDATDKFSDSKIDKILSAADDDLADGNYYEALMAVMKQYEKYGRGKHISALEGLIAAVVAALSGVFSRARVKTDYKTKGKKPMYAYREKSNFALVTNTDTFVNSFVTTRIIKSSSGSGGGGSTHVGSSGRTHGGGGRSF